MDRIWGLKDGVPYAIFHRTAGYEMFPIPKSIVKEDHQETR
jgi:hypothetical protein